VEGTGRARRLGLSHSLPSALPSQDSGRLDRASQKTRILPPYCHRDTALLKSFQILSGIEKIDIYNISDLNGIFLLTTNSIRFRVIFPPKDK
jgi:hypothetical protein